MFCPHFRLRHAVHPLSSRLDVSLPSRRSPQFFLLHQRLIFRKGFFSPSACPARISGALSTASLPTAGDVDSSGVRHRLDATGESQVVLRAFQFRRKKRNNFRSGFRSGVVSARASGVKIHSSKMVCMQCQSVQGTDEILLGFPRR